MDRIDSNKRRDNILESLDNNKKRENKYEKVCNQTENCEITNTNKNDGLKIYVPDYEEIERKMIDDSHDTNRSENENTQYDRSNKQSKHEIIKINIAIGNSTYEVEINTTEGESYISQKTYHEIKYKTKVTYFAENRRVKMYGTSMFKEQNSAIINFMVENIKCTEKFYVIDEVETEIPKIILGSKWIKRNAVRIDSENNMIEFRGKKIKFENIENNQNNMREKAQAEQIKNSHDVRRRGDIYENKEISVIKTKMRTKEEITGGKENNVVLTLESDLKNKSQADDLQVMSVVYNESIKNELPIININIAGGESPALLDSGAAVSLINYDFFEKIKEKIKVNYVSRQVTLQSVTKETIKFHKTIQITFKVGKKNCKNIFFVTSDLASEKYQIILGIDFLVNNQVVLDLKNNMLQIGGEEIEVANNSKRMIDKKQPHVTNHAEAINNVEMEPNYARNIQKVLLDPKQQKIVSLRMDKQVGENSTVALIENKTGILKEKIMIHSTGQSKIIETIISNKSGSRIMLNKNMKIAQIEEIIQIEPESRTPNVYINNIGIQKLEGNDMHKLRYEEFNIADFDLEHLEYKEKKLFQEILTQNYAAFSKSYKTLGVTERVKPEIKLKHNFPIACKPYIVPKKFEKIAEQEIKELLEAKILEPTNSSYAFPVIFLSKGTEGSENKQKVRMATDFRLLNYCTEQYKLFIPHIQDVVQEMAGFKYYTAMDLKSAFFQILLPPEEREKCSIITQFGNFSISRLPFGLKNAGSHFSELMGEVLKDLKKQNIIFYLDDIFIAANSIKSMREKIQMVLNRLIENNLTLDPKKLKIAQTEIQCLGYTISKTGIQPAKKNIEKINDFRIPRNVKEIQSFLGMTNYFRNLIPNYAQKVQPLVNMTKKNMKFIWDEKCNNTFIELKNIILNKPTIHKIDINKKFFLATDASKIAIAGILMQEVDKNLVPVKFFSRTVRPAEINYPSMKLELLAIFQAVKFFHEYLAYAEFDLISDAKSLKYHLDLQHHSDAIARWLLFLSQYTFKFQHIKGTDNPADYISRYVIANVQIGKLTASIFENKKDLTRENFLKYQKEDKNIVIIRQELKARGKNDGKFNNYYLDNQGILHYVIQRDQDKGIDVIVVPEKLKKAVMKVAHATHLGREKTLEIIKKSYTWSGMYYDVKAHVEACVRCAQFKHRNIVPVKPQNMERVPKPGQFLAMDIVGPIVRSNKGNNYILTIIDFFSRYIEAIPIKTITSATIVRCLTEYFARYGLPSTILMDNGPQFRSNVCQQFLQNLGIEIRHSSRYRPNTNGIIERSHKLLKQCILCICEETYDWEDALSWTVLYYNMAKHSATGFEPAVLFYGRDIQLPLKMTNEREDIKNLFEVNQNNQDGDYATFISETIKRALKNNETAFLGQIKQQERFKKDFKRIKENTLKQGDIVFIRNFRKKALCDPKFIGPYRVIDLTRNNNVVIQDIKNPYKKQFNIHVNYVFKMNDYTDEVIKKREHQGEKESQGYKNYNLRARRS